MCPLGLSPNLPDLIASFRGDGSENVLEDNP